MAQLRLVLLAVGVLFHLTYLWLIFDIYFVSPLVHGLPHHRSTPAPPAKRLFLIVGDGLRADKALGPVVYPDSTEPVFLAPHLRSKILSHGTYGVLHTRMPTELRPGHVAMIAGFYEDVSAVTKGWKENPVDFDLVLNQSLHTYSFGLPDILPMFAQGASDPHRIDTYMYGHEFEDFSKSLIELDDFVFRHVDDLFANALDPAVHAQLHAEGTVFFLHLLGCDTAGHLYRPYSAEYYDNIRYIDQQVARLEQQVADFYGDLDTAFVFTADHGMSDFGLHGDGHPNNTRTPLIAWGAGVNRPVRSDGLPWNSLANAPAEREYMADWDLDTVQRHDVAQADISLLMAYLVGLNYPLNLVGRLPLPFIDASDDAKQLALLQNALLLVEQYRIKELEVAAALFRFKPFPLFASHSIAHRLDDIARVWDLPATATALIASLMDDTLLGLDYLQKYNWVLLRLIVTLGFVGWIVYAFLIFVRLFVVEVELPAASVALLGTFGAIAAAMSTLLYFQQLPANYYAYLAFPVFFWYHIVLNAPVLAQGIRAFFAGTSTAVRLAAVAGVVLVFESIVYGFTHRQIFTAVFLVLAVFYPALTAPHPGRVLLWAATCTALLVFTLLDAVKVEDLVLINAGGLAVVAVGGAGWWWIASNPVHVHHATHHNQLANKNHYRLSLPLQTLFAAQLLLVVVLLITTNTAARSLQARTGLPLAAQAGGFAVLGLSLVAVPVLLATWAPTNRDYRVRLLNIFLAFAPTFVILAILFEVVFYLLFSLMLLQWIELEAGIARVAHVSPWVQVLRVATVGFFYLQIAFFGTGNVSLILLFSLDSVYRLLPIFDPFPMGALLMLKLVIPYVLLLLALGIMTHKLHIATFTILTLVISTSDILSLNFFFLVRTEGLWLDIGVTISNYCLAILSLLFMLMLEFISQVLLLGVEIISVDQEAEEAAITRVEKQLIDELEFALVHIDLDDPTPISARLRRQRRGTDE